jgi:positive regulator of sigma E activity
MYEHGTVINIEDKIITIACGELDQCQNCKASSLFCNIKAKNFQALNINNLELKTGDSVEIFLSPAKSIFFSFSILIFPLITFFIGYFLITRFIDGASDGIKITGGFGGLLSGFLIAFIYNSITKKNNYPAITQKYN